MAQDDLKIAELSQVTLPPAVTMALVLVTPVVNCRGHPITSMGLGHFWCQSVSCESFTFGSFCNIMIMTKTTAHFITVFLFLFFVYVYLHACLF